MANPYKNYSAGLTPQTEALPGQSQNNAGGFSYTLDDWGRLRRFLVLGSEGGTYYVGEQKLTRDNAACVERCVKSDANRLVNEIVEISESGRAAKVQPAIFALALAKVVGDEQAKGLVYANLGRVCRTGTHLFTFLEFVSKLEGKGGKGGHGFMRAIARWYTNKPVDRVAYQAVKYRSRENWTHADALRVAHPVADSDDRKVLFDYICGRVDAGKIAEYESLRQVHGFLEVQKAKNASDAARIITEYNLPWEAVPTDYHNDKVVWEAIFDSGALGLTAALRQLPRLTNLGVIDSRPIAGMITDGEALQKARVHPFNILTAMATYKQGYGRGTTTWQPARKIVDALDKAFYAAFGNVTPTGKRINMGLDVSGSMGVALMNSAISAREGSAAMALVTAATESDWEINGFARDYVHLDISPRQRLDDVVRSISGLPFGRTDCSTPMRWALANNREFDAFVIYTDNETYAGNGHPVEHLRKYRDKTGIDAKLVVVGMTATQFTIADPNDAGMLDVAGFDSAAPELISNFIRGDI